MRCNSEVVYPKAPKIFHCVQNIRKEFRYLNIIISAVLLEYSGRVLSVTQKIVVRYWVHDMLISMKSLRKGLARVSAGLVSTRYPEAMNGESG